MSKTYYESWDPMAPGKGPLPMYSKRIKREVADITLNPPHGIFTATEDDDFTKFHAIIVGPEGTPYEGGFFYFFIRFADNYPFYPPKVKLMTTDGGKVRFNPNLYANGKVCLSILGTWSGPSWCAGSTITTVLVSIQSLLNAEPYRNEPGCEHRKTPTGFNEMLTHETMRVAVVGMLDNDSGLVMPQSLRLKMEQEFVKRFTFYEQLATENATFTGKVIKDNLHYRQSTGAMYDYNTILMRLKTIYARLYRITFHPAIPPVETAKSSVGTVIVDLTDCDDEPPRKKTK